MGKRVGIYLEDAFGREDCIQVPTDFVVGFPVHSLANQRGRSEGRMDFPCQDGFAEVACL